MGRKFQPYQRQKGSPKQKNELDSFNLFTDELIAVYNASLKNNNKKKKK